MVSKSLDCGAHAVGAGRRWRLYFTGVLIVLAHAALLLNARPVDAQTPVALDSCNPCSSLADLQTAANNYLVAHNPGPQSLLLLETSLNAPISAFFQETSQTVCIPYTGCFSYPIMTNITPDNMGTAAVDQATYKRALPVPPMVAPSDYDYNEEPALIQGWLTGANGFYWTAQSGVDFWHALRNFPQFTYFVMKDSQTGQSMNVFIGDTVTVSFPGGYTRSYKLQAPGSSQAWVYVPGTLMLNGQCLDCTASTKTSAPGGPINASFIYNSGGDNGSFQGLLNNACYITGQSCVTIVGYGGCSWFAYYLPC